MAAPNLSPLPGLITKHTDYVALLPTITEVESRLLRLKVQTLVLIIAHLFEEDALFDELHVDTQSNGQLKFRTELEDEMGHSLHAGADREHRLALADSKAFEDAETLHLDPSILEHFGNLSPFSRETLEEQLRTAYEDALTATQRKGVAEWNHFWSAAAPRGLVTDFERDPD